MDDRPTEPPLPTSADPYAEIRAEQQRRYARIGAALPAQLQRLRKRIASVEDLLLRQPSGFRDSIALGWALESLRVCLQVAQVALAVMDADAAAERVTLQRELYALRIDASTSHSAAYAAQVRAEAAATAALLAADRLERARWSPWVACGFMAGVLVGVVLGLSL